MEKDERLLPLPKSKDLQVSSNTEYPASYSPFYDEESFEDRRSIREYFHVVYKRLPLIIALAVVVTAAAAFYMYRQPSIFQSSTTMVIEPRKPKVTSKEAISINFGGDINYTNTQLQLLQSPDLMRDVVIALGLQKDPSLFANQNRGLMSTIRSIFSSEKPKAQSENPLPVLSDNVETPNAATSLTAEERTRAEQYAGILLGGLRVDPVERTNLVMITVQSTNPELAPRVADMVAETFIRKDIEREMQGNEQALTQLTKSIEDLRVSITEKEQRYIGEMQQYNLPLRDGKGNDFLAERLQTISTNLLTAEDDRRKLEARYNAAVQANARGEGKNIQDLTESKIYQDMVRQNTERRAKLQDQIRDIEKQIQDKETELSGLRVRYTDEVKEVKDVIAKIENLKEAKSRTEREVTETIERDQKKLEKDAVGGALVMLKSQLDAAIRREGQLRAAYIDEAASAKVQGEAETRLTTLKREIETSRGLLDTLTQRQKEQELANNSGRPDNIKITSTAIKPTGPIGPQRTRNILVAFLVSLAAGIGLAFLLDYLDDSIRSSDDIGRHLGLPTLALIPHQVTSERRRASLAKSGNTGVGSTALITLEDTRSAMAESYRHLRTSLLFSSAGKPPQTILVTSSQPAEGKTTTAINTAITLAQAGADVVVIDCDLRRPRLHSHFDLPNSSGLTNYLSGERNPEALLRTFPNLPKLKIITSGPIPPNPAELLSSHEMRNLLQFLRGNFKHVIIDSPPAISFTDAAILSTLVDGVIIVAMSGKSSIHLMRRFKQRLANIGARIYGVVLNGIKSDSVEYGYYGYGYTYNYYSSHDDETTPLMEETGSVETADGRG